MEYQQIGKMLLSARKYYGLTQNELAEKLMVSRQAISKWENGLTLPDIETLVKISNIYQITIDDIIEGNLYKVRHQMKQQVDENGKDRKKILVIGCGRWGTFIAWYLDKIGHAVTIYGREGSANMRALVKTRQNEYLKLPKSIKLTYKLDRALDADICIISINAQALGRLAGELRMLKLLNKTIVLCMKGIDIQSGRRLSQIIDDELDPSNRTAIWVGPGHIEDFYKGKPNCMVIDSKDEPCRNELIELFSSKLIRFYYGTDLIGNEIGAASKNVIGIAAGMLDALDMSSLKGALMARAPREIARLIKAAGGNERSAYGLCHLGDYEATLFSEHSHNRRFGEKYVLKESYDKLAEGYYTVKAIVHMGESYGVELPICNTIYEILYLKKEPEEAIEKLFLRSLKEEFV